MSMIFQKALKKIYTLVPVLILSRPLLANFLSFLPPHALSSLDTEERKEESERATPPLEAPDSQPCTLTTKLFGG